MKKLFITLALAAATFVGANAQFIIGGTIGGGVNFSKNSYDGDALTSVTDGGFGLGVKLGYAINDNMEIGLKAGIDWAQQTFKTYNPDTKTTGNGFGWYVTPNFRYAFLNNNGFQLGLQADIALFGDDGASIGLKSFGFGVNAKPFVAYNVTDHFIIDAELNFIGLGFNYIMNTEETAPGANDEHKANQFNFGLNVNSNQAAATMNLVTIGLAYKF